VVLTTALLLFGVVDVVRTFPQFLDLAPVLRQLYLDQGIGEFTSDTAAAQAGLVIGITRIVLLVITITVSLLLLSRHRIAFWVPLTGGALGVLVIIAALVVVMVGDPALATYLQQRTAP
jgi:hypothetical protein